jgi:hypothetical protein
MSDEGRDSKVRQVNMRMEPAMEKELMELRELASTQIVTPTMTDIMRAAIKAGIPVLRAELLRSRGSAPPPADPPSDAQARSDPATSEQQKP